MAADDRYGPSGGAVVRCEFCGGDYEMLQDQTTHERCPGRRVPRRMDTQEARQFWEGVERRNEAYEWSKCTCFAHSRQAIELGVIFAAIALFVRGPAPAPSSRWSLVEVD